MIARWTRPLDARWGVPAAALAALLLLAALVPGSAGAAEATGKAAIKPQPGKANTDLFQQGAKLRSSTKGKAVTLDVVDLDLAKSTKVKTKGNLVVAKGKRKAVLRQVTLTVGTKSTAIEAKLGKRSLVFFRAVGNSKVDATAAKLSGATLSLTAKGANNLRGKLGLKSLKGGKLGLLSVNAKQKPVTPEPKPEPEPKPDPQRLDPYFTQCGYEATAKATGTLPEPAALPTLVAGKPVVGPATIPWAIKASFVNYVVNISGGSVHTVADATQAAGAFHFPLTGGEYAINDALDTTDDQAVIDGKGTVLLCTPSKGFRIAISNPTIVIDGESSRIVADFDTNFGGVWTPDQRADFVELDLDGITPFYNHSGSDVTWESIPTTLSDVGAEALCGGDENCPYAAGTPFDPITATVRTPYDTGAGDEAGWNALAGYVGTELPFPLPDPAQGGCEVGVPAGGSTSAARTVDEYHGYWPGTGNPQTAWSSNAAKSAAQPNLSGKTAVEGGSLKWGFRTGLRNSLNSTGDYNLANGATASGEYFGNGGTLVARPSLLGSGAFFTWPAAAGGRYDAGGAGSADDRLVLETQGRVAFCQVQSAQRYATIFTNPTVVIDGAGSRITIDVMSRYRLSWVRGVVDFATVDLSGATFASDTAAGTTTVSWTGAPVTLTADGAKVAGLLAPATYVAGTALDPATVSASFPASP